MENIADEVKASRTQWIASLSTIDLASQAITDLQEWDRYNDKSRSWFEGILPFNHFFLLQNEFESQFSWLIYILVPIVRGQGVATVVLIIFPYQINKSCSVSALLIQRDKRYSNAISSAN